MPGNTRVRPAFRRPQEPGNAVQLPQGAELPAPPGEDFVDIALMPDIVDKAVDGGVKGALQRDGKLYNAEVGGEMSAGFGNVIQKEAAQLGAELVKHAVAEGAEVCGLLDFLKDEIAVHQFSPIKNCAAGTRETAIAGGTGRAVPGAGMPARCGAFIFSRPGSAATARAPGLPCVRSAR